MSQNQFDRPGALASNDQAIQAWSEDLNTRGGIESASTADLVTAVQCAPAPARGSKLYRSCLHTLLSRYIDEDVISASQRPNGGHSIEREKTHA